MASTYTWSNDKLLPNNSNAFGLSGSPALAVFNDVLYCVRQGRGNSGWTWCATFDGTSWSEDKLIPNNDNAFGVSGSPALAVFNNKLYCIRQGRGDSGWLWCASTSDGTNWSEDALIPTNANAFGLSDSPALAVFNNRLYCAREGRGDSGWVWCASTSDGASWSEDALIPNSGNAYGTSGGPALAVYNNKLYCIREGRGNSGQLYWATFDGTKWSEDKILPNKNSPYGTSGRPGLAVFDNKLFCINEGRGDSGELYWSAFDGTNWSGDNLLPCSGTSGPPALAVYNNKLYCIREGKGGSGWTWSVTCTAN